MKRRRDDTYSNRPFKKPRTSTTKTTTVTVPTARLYRQPKRTYPNSRVPLASRGYTPNRKEYKAWSIGAAGVGALQLTNVSTAGVITPIFLPILGSDMTMRIGRKVTIKTIQVRGNIYLEQALTMASGTTPQITPKIMLLWDSQPNGTIATVADIWQVAGTPHSYLNLDNRDRFRVLRSEVFTMDAMLISSVATQSVASWNRTQHNFEWYLKNQDLDVVFNATNGGTIADISSGALLLVFICDVAASANDINCKWVSRVRFEDD